MVEYSTSGNNASILRINKIDGDTVVEQREVEAIKAYYADDLLNALELIFDLNGKLYIPNPADIKHIRSVIAKAKGE